MSYPNDNDKLNVIKEIKSQYLNELLENINSGVDDQGNLDISLEELNKLIDKRFNDITNHDFNLSGNLMFLRQYSAFRKVCSNLILQELMSNNEVVAVNGEKVDMINYKIANQDIKLATDFIRLKGDNGSFSLNKQDSMPVKAKEFFRNIWQVIVQTFSTNSIDYPVDLLNRQNLYFRNQLNHKKGLTDSKKMQVVKDENNNVTEETSVNRSNKNTLSTVSAPTGTVDSSNVKLLSKQEKARREL